MGSSNPLLPDFIESMLPRPLIHFQHDVCLALSWFPILVGIGLRPFNLDVKFYYARML